MTDGTLVAPDGCRLHVTWRLPPGGPPRGILIMVHGFSAHAGLYAETAAFFAEQGLLVCAYDSRGHGRSDGRRGHVRRFSDYATDLGLVVSDVGARHPGLPIILLGHSQGGTVALDYVLHYAGAGGPAGGPATGETLAGLVLLCPYLGLELKVPAYKRALSPILNVLWPTLALGNELAPERVAREPETLRLLVADPLIHHVATPRWFTEVQKAQAAILADAAGLRTPTWLGLARADAVVSNEAIRAFEGAVVAPLTVMVYESATHEILLDPERIQVRADITTWVVGRLLSPYNSDRP